MNEKHAVVVHSRSSEEMRNRDRQALSAPRYHYHREGRDDEDSGVEDEFVVNPGHEYNGRRQRFYGGERGGSRSRRGRRASYYRDCSWDSSSSSRESERERRYKRRKKEKGLVMAVVMMVAGFVLCFVD